MKPSPIRLRAMSVYFLLYCACGNTQALPTEKDVRERGCFLFPQSEARILCDTKELRLSAWNNKTIFYVQALLWNDDSMEIGVTSDGRDNGDSSRLSLDIDANQKISPNLDRKYFLNPWLSMSGLYYSLLLGRHSSTSIKDDSSGAGSICYVTLSDGRRIRVDNYVISTKEISRIVGDNIRLCYLAESAVPAFKVNSVGDTNRPPKGGCYHIPLETYHNIVLGNGISLQQDTIVASWSTDPPSFERTHTVTNSNERWFSSAYVHIDSHLGRVSLTNNTPEMIRGELSDEHFLSAMAASLGVASQDVARLRLAYNTQYKWFELEQNGSPPHAFDTMRKSVDDYVKGRNEGHTRAFFLATAASRAKPAVSEDAGIRAIVDSEPLIPTSWLKRSEAGTITNRAGAVASHTITTTVVDGKTVTNEVVHVPKTDEVCPWEIYTLVDGDICWRYYVQFKADGSVDRVHESRCDAKEVDPRYRRVIGDMEDEVTADMKKNGTHGQFGSVHTFWHLKKTKLKATGIEWRSPAELNPNTHYD